jgi:hypothetical protein
MFGAVQHARRPKCCGGGAHAPAKQQDFFSFLVEDVPRIQP